MFKYHILEALFIGLFATGMIILGVTVISHIYEWRRHRRAHRNSNQYKFDKAVKELRENRKNRYL